MHGEHGRYRFLIALAISLALASSILKFMGLVMMVAGIVTGLVMTSIAHRQFNGVTGDVFGATNEITRMACLIVTSVMIRWV